MRLGGRLGGRGCRHGDVAIHLRQAVLQLQILARRLHKLLELPEMLLERRLLLLQHARALLQLSVLGLEHLGRLLQLHLILLLAVAQVLGGGAVVAAAPLLPLAARHV